MVSETLSLPDERRVGIGRPAARSPHPPVRCAKLVVMRSGLALVVALPLMAGACGQAVPAGPRPAPATISYQALVAGASDPEGNTLTVRFDSMPGRARQTAVPTNASDARFTSSGAISYLLPDSIHTLAPSGGARTDATAGSGVIVAFAWNDGGTLAYLAHANAAGAGSRLVIRDPAGAATTVSLSPAAAGGTPSLRFSPDGRLLLLVDVALTGSSTLQVRRLDGSLVFQASGATEATWAGARRVYFLDARGVDVADLTAGVTRTILPDLRWHAPDTSPDGRAVVFELRDGGGQPRLELLDTSTDAVVPGFEVDEGTAARFVSATEVWFHEAGGAAIVSLDVERRTEAPTGLTGMVTDVRQVRP